MALTYRTPMEEIVTCFEPSVQALIANTAAKVYQATEEDLCSLFNFHLTPVGKKKLSGAGIYLSPFSGVPHSHPACKTIENHLLYVVLPQYLDNTFYFVGIKERKLSLLKRRDQRLSAINVINRFVTSADKVRYSNDFVVYNSKPHKGLKRQAGSLESETLRDLVGPLMRHRAKKLFLHDELHYWSSKDLGVFLEVMQPELVLATIVYPPELLFKQLRSLNPWCYTYEVKGQELLFFPDGVHSEGYQQPLSGGYLLECNELVLADGTTYCVDIICSKFAHHLVAITRGKAKKDTYRSFGDFEASTSTGLASIARGVVPCFPVNHLILNKIYRYLRTLKKPDKESAVAKLSQLVNEPSGAEINFVESFARLVIDTKQVDTELDKDALKVFMGKTLGKLPKVIARRLECVRALSLSKFIEGLDSYAHTFKAKRLHCDSAWINCFEIFTECEEEFDLVASLDSQFMLGRKATLVERAPMRYAGMAPLSDKYRNATLDLHSDKLIKTLAAHVKNSLLSPHSRKISRRQVREFVLHLCRNDCFFSQLRYGNATRVKLGKEELALEHFLNVVISKALAIFRRFLRVTFAEVGVRWFFAVDRSFQKYLCCDPDHPKCEAALEHAWGLVLRELDSANGRFIKLVEGKTSEPAAADGGTIDLEELPSTGVTILEENAPRVDSLFCGCGLRLELSGLLLKEHNFTCPDKLRGRKAGWYSRDGSAYTYTGATHESLGWPDWLDEWMIVNGIDLSYDCCLYQVYESGSAIGWHADDEAIFAVDGSILTVNLEGQVVFGLRCAAGCVLNDISGACKFEMPAGFQQDHKHCVREASEGRSSLTFRKLRGRSDLLYGEGGSALSDVSMNGTDLGPATDSEVGSGTDSIDMVTASSELKYQMGVTNWEIKSLKDDIDYITVPMVGDGNCFWRSIAHCLGMDFNVVKQRCVGITMPDQCLQDELAQCALPNAFTTNAGVYAAVVCLRVNLRIWLPEERLLYKCTYPQSRRMCDLKLSNEHFEPLLIKNGCVVQAIAAALDRDIEEVVNVLDLQGDDDLTQELFKGKGLDLSMVEVVLQIFDIRGHVRNEGVDLLLNENGRLERFFDVTDDHMSFIPRMKDPSHSLLTSAPLNKGFSEHQLHHLFLAGTSVSYLPLRERARVLANSLHQASTGKISSALFHHKENLESQFRDFSLIQVNCIVGTFGSGKSSLFKNLLKVGKGKVLDYVSPRRALADDFKRVAGLNTKRRGRCGKENWRVSTFELFLERAPLIVEGQVVIFDEMQLYPPGYFDLVFGLMTRGAFIFIVGDPIQSDYDSEKDRMVFDGMMSNMEQLLGGIKYKYNVVSRRFTNSNFIGRLPCEIPTEKCQYCEEHVLGGTIDTLPLLEECWREVFLVSSFDEKVMVTSFIPSANVLTFGESTGLTFDYGTIIISGVSERANEKRWVTALSRFRKNICFINCSGTSYQMLAERYKGRCLSKFLSKTATTTDLHAILPGHPVFTEHFTRSIGKDEGVREEKLAGDPWLKTMLDLMQEEEMQVAEIPEVKAAEEWFKTHLPREELESVRARWVDKIIAKEYREVRIRDMVSNQFTDEHSKQVGGLQLTNAAERYEAIYPRHRANDTVTFIMAVKKRLRFSTPAKEQAKLHEASNYGKFLLTEFLKLIPLKPEHNGRYMSEAKWEFEQKKTSKSAATIENHSGRSCKDWLLDVGLIFSKSQLCTKFDNRFRVAKAAQSIVCFQHSVLCRFAPYMRYIEKKLHEVLPKRFYIHSGKGLDELNDWVISNDFSGVCTESDYEAFDASQDEYILAFEIELMRYLRIPNDLIEDYRYIKTHLGSKLGNFAIMRFSGEASTFLFNTMANMLFTFLRYRLTGRESICFAGDDMCASRRLSKTSTHESFLKKIKLKAKVQFTDKPTFCGWHLCPDGIYKKPQLVLERMCIARELNNLANCIDNYAIEVAFAYKLGERAVNRMDEEELGAFYNCVRIIVRNKHLLKSNVCETFTSADYPAQLTTKLISLGYCL